MSLARKTGDPNFLNTGEGGGKEREREIEKDTQVLTMTFFFSLQRIVPRDRDAYFRAVIAQSSIMIRRRTIHDLTYIRRLSSYNRFEIVLVRLNCYELEKRNDIYIFRFLGLSLFPLDFKQDYFTTLNTIRRVSVFC